MFSIIPESESLCESRQDQTQIDASSTSSIMQDRSDRIRCTVLQSAPQPLNDTKYLSEVFYFLHDVVGRLSSLHQHGWLHQNLSYENILRVGDKTIIADLECAKATSDVFNNADFPTESPFRAVEVAENAHLFVPTSVQPADCAVQVSKSPSRVPSEADPSGAMAADEEAPSAIRSFRYNPLHDLESIPWLGLHLLLTSTYRNTHQLESSKTWAYWMDTQHDLGRRMFRDDSRQRIMRSPGSLGEDMGWCHLPPTIAAVVRQLDALFTEFSSAYQQLEVGPELPGLDACYMAVAESMAQRMTSIAKNTLRSHPDLRRISAEEVKRTKKREVVRRWRPRHLVFQDGEIVDVITEW